MADTVLIAAPDVLGALTRREDLTRALAFPDSDALAALDAITRQRPRLVAVDRLFASTPRGSALIERLRRDPALATCEIRLVASDVNQDESLPAIAGTAAASESLPGTFDALSLDEHGTRIAPRYEMREHVDVTLDGRPARLIDLSQGGAQLVATVAVKPQQRVRVSMRTIETRVRLSATVQWAQFEMPAEGPRYRAGVRFAEADAEAIRSFIDANKR